MENVLLISDAAKKVDVEAHVLRYWEEELELPIKRNELGHRYYTEEDVKRFQEVKELKERGLQLKAIRMILKNGRLNLVNEKEEKGSEVIQTKQAENPDIIENAGGKTAGIQIVGGETTGIETTSMNTGLQNDSKDAKMLRLQWLLKQLFKETLQENNEMLCAEMKDGLIKEMDYQFRMQEEREEERAKERQKRDEEYYKKIDELLRKKRGLPKK
ncbi:MAG: helix-turn-helix domain-containing protein [Lachnospiraceae bacterium]